MKKILALLLVNFFFVSLNASSIFYVKTDGNDSNNGRSWATAFKDVQKAIDAAANIGGGEVWIAKGSYTHGSELEMKNNVAIYGGFTGTETSLNARQKGNETILYGDKSYSIIKNRGGVNNSAKIDSIVIMNGNNGIYNYNSSPTIINCTIIKNRGGVYNINSSPRIINCTFYGTGNGIINSQSSPIITNCTISMRSYIAIHNMNTSNAKIINCIIWGSSYSIYDDTSSRPVVKNCIVDDGYNSGENIIRKDPKFGILGYYGGNVPIYPVLPGSPAIGMGVNDKDISTIDVRGLKRTMPCTIGAYEFSKDDFSDTATISITKHPSSITVTETQTASFTAEGKSSNNKAVSYKWFVDKGDGNGFTAVKCTDKTYSFTAYLSMDGYQFRCEISNGSEKQTTSVATLKVSKLSLSDIQIITEPQSSLELFEKTKFNLEVSAVEKDGKKLTYTWYVDKQNGKGFVKAGSKSILSITPASNMVGWQYYCEVSNGIETRNTLVSTITEVRAPVKLTGKPKAITAFEGNENQGFSVSATGYNVKYQWQVYKVVGYNAKGKAVYDWVDIEGATSANYKPESEYANNGLKYRCKVYNDGSLVYTSGVSFTVREAPKVEKIEILQNKETLQLEGNTAIAYEDYPIDLKVSAKGYKIKYQWYKNGEKIKGATSYKYTIKKPLESRDIYYCEVYNGDLKDQSSKFVLEVRECPLPVSFEGRTLYVHGSTDMGESLNFNMLFLKKTTLKLSCMEYAVGNPSFSYKRTSPKKAAISLKFKLYTDMDPISKFNTISYSYSGDIEFKDGVFHLNLQDKKNGMFNGSFTDLDIETADKASLLTLPLNKKIIIGEEELALLDKKNFSLGGIKGTYSYKSNKNGTGVLKLSWKEGSNKYTSEVSMLALSEKSGVAVVSTNRNEGRDKFISSDFAEFEILDN